jgi:regulator of RNase E activity RraA
MPYPVLVRPTKEWVEIDRLLDMGEGVPAHSVAVVATDDDVDAALWGGLVSARTRARGGRAAVVHGAGRDLHQIRQLGFPVFATQTCPRDIRSRGFVDTIDEKVICRGAR